MSEYFKQLSSRFKGHWAGWSLVQRIMIVGVAVVVLVGMAALLRVSAMPTLVSVIDAPIRDEAALDRIVLRLNQEGVRTTVTPTGIVQVPDEQTARRMRAILISENLIPSGIDPWQVFDRDRWTITDFERNVNLQRSHTQMITNHIRAIDGVDDASVVIVWPERTLFQADQNPVTASVRITPTPAAIYPKTAGKLKAYKGFCKLPLKGLEMRIS